MKALEQLGHLQKLDESLQWNMEIGREIRALESDLSEIKDSELDSQVNVEVDVEAVAAEATETLEVEVGDTAYSSPDDPLRHAA